MAFDPDKYLSEKSSAAPPAAASFDPDAYLAQKNSAAPLPEKSPESTYQKVLNVAAQGARHIPILGAAFNPLFQEAAMRGMDYAAGGVRTGIAGAAGVADKEDLLRTLKGQAPRTGEFLAKAGVPEGAKLPYVNASVRDAVGFAGDVATDPLTYLNPAGILGEAGQASASAGQSMYKWGLKNLDIEGAKYGKAPVSDLLMKERVTGNAREIANQMDELAARRKIERDAILQAATDAGATSHSGDSLKYADDFINKIRATGDPRLEPLINKMDDEVGQLWGVDRPNPNQLSQLKTNTYSVIGDQAYNDAKQTPMWKAFQKEVARGQREEIERSVGETLGPQAGQALAQKNDELGRLLTTQDRAKRDAGVYERKNAATSVDGMLIGHALESGHGGGVAPLIFKKLTDVGKESTFRTTGGLALQDLGGTRIPDVLLRRGIIDYNNPWGMQK